MAETCVNGAWIERALCMYGCLGAGICKTPPTPQLSAIVDGSDVSISWSAPMDGLTCALFRDDNLGQGFQKPQNLIVPCPASAVQPCNAYDPFLLRGDYDYQLRCTDGVDTGVSDSFPPNGHLQPGAEICVSNWGTSIEVHTAAPDNNHDKLERKISIGASLASTVGIAYAAGTVFVASRDNGKVMAFDRRAADADALATPTSPEAPTASLRTLTLSLPDSNVTDYRPEGLAVLGNELIVAIPTLPGFVAAYPTGFTSATRSPNWVLRAKNQGKSNGLAAPYSVAVDTGTGTGSGNIFVGNRNDPPNGPYVVNGYHRDDIGKHLDPGNFTDDLVTPFTTITLTAPPDSIAIDSTTHTLYVTQAGNSGSIGLYASNATGEAKRIGNLQGKQLATPLALTLLPDSNGGALYVVDNMTGGIISLAAGSTGVVDQIVNFRVPSLVGNAAGVTICN